MQCFSAAFLSPGRLAVIKKWQSNTVAVLDRSTVHVCTLIHTHTHTHKLESVLNTNRLILVHFYIITKYVHMYTIHCALFL